MSKNRTSKSSPRKDSKALRMSAESASTSKPEMNTTEIRDLIDFIAKSGLNEVDIETKELKLHVKREPDQKIFKSSPVSASPAVALAPPVSVESFTQQQSAPPASPASRATESSSKKTILSLVKSRHSSICERR
jgi:acetyl-CoA carboxylase biotin carboxyl carrier protein